MSTWFEGNPCNMHLLDLADAVKDGVNAAGLKGLRCNSIGVSSALPPLLLTAPAADCSCAARTRAAAAHMRPIAAGLIHVLETLVVRSRTGSRTAPTAWPTRSSHATSSPTRWRP